MPKDRELSKEEARAYLSEESLFYLGIDAHTIDGSKKLNDILTAIQKAYVQGYKAHIKKQDEIRKWYMFGLKRVVDG